MRDGPSYLTQAWTRPENQISTAVVLVLAAVVLVVTSMRETGSVAVDFASLMPGDRSHEVTLTRFLFTPAEGWVPSGSPARVIFHRRLPRRFTVAVDVWQRGPETRAEVVLRASGIERSIPVGPERTRHNVELSPDADVRSLEFVIPPGVQLRLADLVVRPSEEIAQ